MDKTFIREISEDSDYKTIINAVIAMAHNLKLSVIAEGVETEEQLRFLRSAGCDEIQGYLCSAPLPTDQF